MRVENIYDEKDRQLILETDKLYQLDVTPQNRISIPEKRVRLFSSVNSFLNEQCSNISGRIQTFLHPIYCFCSRTVQSNNFLLDKNEKGDVSYESVLSSASKN